MLRAGQPEIDAVTEVIRSGKLFRYREGGECGRFEERYAKTLGVKFAHMCSSGTNALTAALGGLGLGPGDEVIVPAHTYMATAIAVLAVGAIPVVADVDESITLSPEALDETVGPRTRAVIPVHMWGLACDMDAIMKVARKRKLLVVEDACQFVGGAYEGRMGGSIGHAGAFSFNYFKNMTCGEGGAVVTSDPRASQRARCLIDSCGFFWNGRKGDVTPFAASGARASELEGAMMNAQLDQIGGMVAAMRRQKKKVGKAAAKAGLTLAPAHSPEGECGNQNVFLLPTAEAADRFAQRAGGTVCAKTGRHTYTEWDPILNQQGAHHPALDPYRLAENRECRKEVRRDSFPRSLEILSRAVMVANHPDRPADEVSALIEKIKGAAEAVLSEEAVAAGK